MINGITHRQAVLNLLADGRPHYSAEFRDRLGLLEYRKRLSELRDAGYQIVQTKIFDPTVQAKRPGYQLLNPNLQRSLL